jgi:hypothetical protein
MDKFIDSVSKRLTKHEELGKHYETAREEENRRERINRKMRSQRVIGKDDWLGPVYEFTDAGRGGERGRKYAYAPCCDQCITTFREITANTLVSPLRRKSRTQARGSDKSTRRGSSKA